MSENAPKFTILEHAHIDGVYLHDQSTRDRHDTEFGRPVRVEQDGIAVIVNVAKAMLPFLASATIDTERDEPKAVFVFEVDIDVPPKGDAA